MTAIFISLGLLLFLIAQIWAWTSKDYGPKTGKAIIWYEGVLQPRLKAAEQMTVNGHDLTDIEHHSYLVHINTYSGLSFKDLKDVHQDAEWCLRMLKHKPAHRALLKGIVKAVKELKTNN